MVRPILYIAGFSSLFGLSRAFRHFLQLFVRQDSGEGPFPAWVRNVGFAEVAVPVLAWGLAGVLLALLLALVIRRFVDTDLESALGELRRPYLVLVVPTLMTAAALLSLAWSPLYPFGLNLAVSSLLEGAFADSITGLLFAVVLTQALVRLAGAWRRRLPALAIVTLAMIGFTIATPARFYEEGIGQGNMFKYVRMAQTLSGTGTLNIERAEENPEPTLGELLSFVPGWLSGYVRASAALLGGDDEGAAEASRVNRSMFRSVSGGVHYINAPGPGVLLTPAYLLDRYLDRWLGWNRQIAVMVFWQLLGALLVLEMVAAATGVAARSGGVLVGFAVAMSVPFLFYTFQIYPELPAALLILFAFRKLVMEPTPTGLGVFLSGLSLAALPWLHQKYSVLAAVLGLFAAAKLMRRSPGGIRHHPYKLVLLGLPLAFSAFSVFLYNHTLTGSFSPTATFEAAERSSFEPWNFFKGFLGLMLDRENGLLVFAPIYLLAFVGARALLLKERRLFLPLALVLMSYLIVIASFPYWPGAISTMGRYILSVLPLMAIPMALVAERALTDGMLAGVGATLLAGSFAVSVSFARDLIPSYQPWLFWERILFTDAYQYLPTFLSDGFLGSGPAHFPKLIVLLFLLTLALYLLRDRVYLEPESVGAASTSFHRSVCGGALAVMLAVFAGAFVLERWPGNESERGGPDFRRAQPLSRERMLWSFGTHGFEGGGVWVPGGGTTRFWLRSRTELADVDLRFMNGPADNVVAFRERRGPKVDLALPPRGAHQRTVRLRRPYRFEGPRGTRYVYDFTIHSQESFVPSEVGASEDDRRLGTFVRVR